MRLEFTFYLIPLFVTAIVAFMGAVFSQRRNTSGSTLLTVHMLLICSWALGYALEVSVVGLGAKIFFGKVQYFSIAPISAVWFAFALKFSNRAEWLTYKNRILLAIIPTITLLLIWTTELHGLMWADTWIEQGTSFSTLGTSYGSWFWVHALYTYVLLSWATVLLVRMLLRSSRLYRLQAATISLSVIAPLGANIWFVLDLPPELKLDPTPFAFTISGVALSWALLRLRFLDIMPVAQRAVVAGMPDGVIVFDAKNRVVNLNPAAEPIVGHSATEVIGQRSDHLFSDHPALVTYLQAVVDGGTEMTLQNNGHTRHFDVQVSALWDREDVSTGRLLVLRDITSRKEAEIALSNARDQAVEASRTKSEMLARVSHELRTPLGVILGYTQLLEDGTFGSISDTQKGIANNIIDSTNYLTSLVVELLDQAQLDQGRVILQLEAFDIGHFITEIETKMRVLAERKALKFTIKVVEKECQKTWQGDKKRLQQVLINLINNAIKFTKEGEIKIVFSFPEADCWRIQVIDTGIGIPKEIQPHIFEPFQQVDGSSTREYGGAGLGLSIVKQFITLMGGSIVVDSQEGEGSSFTIDLPKAFIQTSPQES